MIVKHVPMRSLGKRDFASLANYITDAQSKDRRLGHLQATNCEAGSIQDAITEVLATQHTNTRAEGDKTDRLIVSFRAGEHPHTDVQQKWPGATVSLRSGYRDSDTACCLRDGPTPPVADKVAGRRSTAAHHIPGT